MSQNQDIEALTREFYNNITSVEINKALIAIERIREFFKTHPDNQKKEIFMETLLRDERGIYKGIKTQLEDTLEIVTYAGYIEETKGLLTGLERIANDLEQKPPYNEEDKVKIMKEAYKNGIPYEIRNVEEIEKSINNKSEPKGSNELEEKYSRIINKVERILKHIEEAEEVGLKTGKKIVRKLEEYKNSACKNFIEIQIKKAEDALKKGWIGEAEEYAGKAVKYIPHLKKGEAKELKEKSERVLNEVYYKGIEIGLNKSSEIANREVEFNKSHTNPSDLLKRYNPEVIKPLGMAIEYAKKAKVDISDAVRDILGDYENYKI